jgi:hypothetical protein
LSFTGSANEPNVSHIKVYYIGANRKQTVVVTDVVPVLAIGFDTVSRTKQVGSPIAKLCIFLGAYRLDSALADLQKLLKYRTST